MAGFSTGVGMPNLMPSFSTLAGVLGMLMSGDNTDAIYGNSNFLLEVEGITLDTSSIVAGFQSISGGGIKVEKREVTHGGSWKKEYLPGPMEFENITLNRGLTQNRDLLTWMLEIAAGDLSQRRSGSIILLDNDGLEARRWSFFDAFPVSWSPPELNGDGSAVAIEKFELAVGYGTAII